MVSEKPNGGFRVDGSETEFSHSMLKILMI